METTRSFSSSTLGSIFASATFLAFPLFERRLCRRSLLGEVSEGAVEAPSD